jgi:hypothetical protein
MKQAADLAAATAFDPAAAKAGLARTGCVMLPAFTLFSNGQLTEMEQLCRALPEEVITLGDAGEPNNLYVGRFMVDRAGDLPALVNRPHSDCLLALLDNPAASSFFEEALGAPHVIRRCQVNRMVDGSFIGRHLDVDSNPDYVVSVVVQLGRSFEGGEFVVYPHESAQPVWFKPGYGTVIIARCDKPHEVKKVTSEERSSLVYFYSPHRLKNRRAV